MDKKQDDGADHLKCPDCHARLKKKRGRRVDECELICGGCGRVFDVCGPETLENLKNQRG
jgi:hypothetical protein